MNKIILTAEADLKDEECRQAVSHLSMNLGTTNKTVKNMNANYREVLKKVKEQEKRIDILEKRLNKIN